MEYNANELFNEINKEYDIGKKIVDLGLPVEIEYSKSAIDDIIIDIDQANKPFFTDNVNYNTINNIDNIYYTLPSDAIKGDVEQNTLSNSFFSKENVQLINDNIRYNVWTQINKSIEDISLENLSNIMKATFLNSADFLTCDIKKQIEQLNNKVIDHCTPIVVSEIKQYLGYIKEISQENRNKIMEYPRWMHKNNYTFDMTNIPT